MSDEEGSPATLTDARLVKPRDTGSAAPRLDALPSSIAQRIASFLDRTDAVSLSRTCRSLVSAGESRVYRSLDVLFHPISHGHTDPAIANGGHRPTSRLIKAAAQRRTPYEPSEFGTSALTIGLTQGGLRHFSRLFDSVPTRRSHVHEIYIDLSKTPRSNTDDLRRTIITLGTLRMVRKLTIVLSLGWETLLRALITCAPHIERLTILADTALDICADPIFPLPRLKHLAVEGMNRRLETMLVKTIVGAELESLVIMDWPDAWQPRSPDPVARAICQRRGMKTLFVPKKCFEGMRVGSLRDVQVLGLQGAFQPTLRFTVVRIPPLPRLRRLFLFLNRSSTFVPLDRIGGVALDPTTPACAIPEHMLSMIDAAPRLTEITYTDLLRPNIRGEVEIRTYLSEEGETFYHVRVFSPQFCGLRPDFWSIYRDVSGAEGVWQDWSSWRGVVVGTDTLERIYELAGGVPRPGRRLKLSTEAWSILQSQLGQISPTPM